MKTEELTILQEKAEANDLSAIKELINYYTEIEDIDYLNHYLTKYVNLTNDEEYKERLRTTSWLKAYYYLNRHDMINFHIYIMKLADLDDLDAKLILAEFCYNECNKKDLSINKPKVEETLKLLNDVKKLAKDKEYVFRANKFLRSIYFNAEDFETLKKLSEEHIEENDIEAYLALSTLYHEGLSVEKDEEKADYYLTMYMKAANK